KTIQERLAEFGRKLVGKHHMRPHQMPARSDAADDARQLQRSGLDCSLSDCYVEGLVGIPAMVEVLDQPIRRRHQPGLFTREVDSSFLAVAEFAGVLRNAINAEL